MIKVGRWNEPNAVYIGRPNPRLNLKKSPLANPFVMRNKSIDERNRVCDLFDEWINDRIQNNDKAVIEEIERLKVIAMQGDLVLGCWCSPKRCHGESIKRIIDSMIT